MLHVTSSPGPPLHQVSLRSGRLVWYACSESVGWDDRDGSRRINEERKWGLGNLESDSPSERRGCKIY